MSGNEKLLPDLLRRIFYRAVGGGEERTAPFASSSVDAVHCDHHILRGFIALQFINQEHANYKGRRPE